ncbi:MAG TPA: hypothetical protein DDZ80_09825 [Cyanobacteria bacterium UBA8803]|nr:hypothetical protein [Cyanobacteria bacterium UBA9273]HBL58791.1 hypothetical protein [Cyanobacteria bacterium UBA8803]
MKSSYSLARGCRVTAIALWYETVGTLIELLREYPNDENLADAWKTLLNSVGLNPPLQILSVLTINLR